MQKPILAICLGFQMLFTSSEEFKYTKGLNILKSMANKGMLSVNMIEFEISKP